MIFCIISLFSSYDWQPITGYIAYDVVVQVKLEADLPFINFSLVGTSFEPSGCSLGDEEYTITDNHSVRLSQLVASCTATVLLSAQV